ncbi:hypothetical protein M8R20_36950 [Pseudomonas sp. R2.Fl]|nr:hypothetical protein [Pseudomonas sp. R2.Fl]
MKLYKVQIEGILVEVSLDGVKDVCGLFTTFYVDANSARNAVHRVGELLNSRLVEHKIKILHGRFVQSLFFVKDIWEVDGAAGSGGEYGTGGFSLYRTRGVSLVGSVLRSVFIRRFKREFVVSMGGYSPR